MSICVHVNVYLIANMYSTYGCMCALCVPRIVDMDLHTLCLCGTAKYT